MSKKKIAFKLKCLKKIETTINLIVTCLPHSCPGASLWSVLIGQGTSNGQQFSAPCYHCSKT